ncbi:class I SAM-dependent methyltransferase [Devosia ginsengisoli]|uniref:class I SAM-dependent methyltransferase n=1 Tax=Devosia ginsengisoli TaxID=400770 RepID=UPI0026EDE13A|nr:class I SAM-dependent methyltransferase [Devosia ginsengisoli]MCR6669813.1 class I SAM-dependent methyltransferase [Devosia ginsengisoli]
MKRNINRARSQSWDAVAHWYAGWTGSNGSRYHRTLAVPLLLEMLDPRAGEHIADLGCGPGILAPPVAERGARFVGVDLSPRLIAEARKNHGDSGRFLVGDVTRLPRHANLPASGFDAACFLLSIQDINPLDAAMASAASLLKPGGRLAIVMLHPCFRVPRQSGWGWDEGRGAQVPQARLLSDTAGRADAEPWQGHHAQLPPAARCLCRGVEYGRDGADGDKRDRRLAGAG